ncbi:MAG TPA: LptA/OstA family protein [Methylomusa anaerophila]|uniref:LPS-assembly protein LptD n=1 Tax=Methylomusa anaerophila TaxID=1930071 RepID=A0A348AP05_9FIRM|nr:LptA/OstA family protein [Methylomusa anaerophila]BBB92803.1 LPS-assembly protein LptD [Methylomusa anaerophila]HML87346.1 LptA/OstA family protein [Methylomusa anaerophila]
MKIKALIFIIVFIVLLTGIAAAKPVITADQTYFDINTGLYVLKGNVFIQVNNRTITAGQAKVDMASLEVWGSGGISVTQDDIHFTGDSVYVCGANSQASIDGGVEFARTNLSIKANKVDFNWRSRIANFCGDVEVTQGNNRWKAANVVYNVDTDTFL